MPKISLMIHTASCDAFLRNQGISSYFQALVDNLTRQTFQEFELIYVDTFYEDNQKNLSEYPIQIKHVPIHPNHRYWYDRGNVYISAAKNTGILYADGELLITCDDSEFFPDNFLELYWNYYQKNLFMHALHKRMKTIETKDGKPTYPISGDVYINDHRFNNCKPSRIHQLGSWTYAGTSFRLKDALILNGFNERMDGCKSLEDCDFGTRLALLDRKFVMDENGFAYIVDHQSYADASVDIGWEKGNDAQENIIKPTEIKKKAITNFIAVENYGMLRCGKELMDITANKNPLTKKHFGIIQRETIKYRNFDPLAPEYAEQFETWLKTPTFDLKKEREELRKSNDWKW